jgi:hypothetical protein
VLAISRRIFAAVGLAFWLTAVLSTVPGSAADDKEIANALRVGGLVIVVRHGSTFRDQADTDPLHPDNIAAQRQLNDAGKAAARAFGEALRQIGVPAGAVYSSQFNRAYETAVLAGLKDIVKSADITEGGSSCHQLRTIVARQPSVNCLPRRQSLAPTRSSSPTSQISSMRSAKTGST